MRDSCQTDFEFHMRKADRSVGQKKTWFWTSIRWLPMRKIRWKKREINVPSPWCASKIIHWSNLSVAFQKYVVCADNITPFILTIITPLMKRVHEKVGSIFCLQVKSFSPSALFSKKLLLIYCFIASLSQPLAST